MVELIQLLYIQLGSFIYNNVSYVSYVESYSAK